MGAAQQHAGENPVRSDIDLAVVPKTAEDAQDPLRRMTMPPRTKNFSTSSTRSLRIIAAGDVRDDAGADEASGGEQHGPRFAPIRRTSFHRCTPDQSGLKNTRVVSDRCTSTSREIGESGRAIALATGRRLGDLRQRSNDGRADEVTGGPHNCRPWRRSSPKALLPAPRTAPDR